VPKTTASKKQIDFLKRLFAERENSAAAQAIRRDTLALYQADELTFEVAADVIEAVKGIPRDKPQREVPEEFNHLPFGEWDAMPDMDQEAYIINDVKYVVERYDDTGWIGVYKLQDLTREDRHVVLSKILKEYG
jgi:hypothetical protein